jgi:hypothetical protein
MSKWLVGLTIWIIELMSWRLKSVILKIVVENIDLFLRLFAEKIIKFPRSIPILK